MRYQAAHIGGTLAQAPPAAPADLVRAVRSIGLQPRDQRVRQVWNQLRARGMLNQDIWVKQILRRLWMTGLRPGNRPRTAARLAAALRTLGLTPWAAPSAAETPWPTALTTYPVPYGWPSLRRRRRRPYWWRVPAQPGLRPFAPTPPPWRVPAQRELRPLAPTPPPWRVPAQRGLRPLAPTPPPWRAPATYPRRAPRR
jgi:hypothetical protein